MKVGLLAITLAAVLLGACFGSDEDTRAEITALRLEVAALAGRQDATGREVDALAKRVDALASDAASPVDVATTAIVVSKRVRLDETVFIPDQAGKVIGSSIPYCVTYVIAGVTDETCEAAYGFDEERPGDPLAAQGRFVRNCWNNETRIAEPLPDCWN